MGSYASVKPLWKHLHRHIQILGSLGDSKSSALTVKIHHLISTLSVRILNVKIYHY